VSKCGSVAYEMLCARAHEWRVARCRRWHFVRIYAERMNKKIETIPTRVMEALVSHSWPGNVRSCKNSASGASL